MSWKQELKRVKMGCFLMECTESDVSCFVDLYRL